MTLLAVEAVEAGYGRINVLAGISLAVAKGECVGVLGHNGMGKSTLLRTIVGLLPTTRGQISWQGQRIERLPPFRRARLGLGYVPQGRQIFPALSVRENLELAARAKDLGPGEVATVLGDFPELVRLQDRQGGALSGGEQQILALARALCGRPVILLLDEPTEGIQPSIVEAIAERITLLRQSRGLTVLLVEQNLDFVASLATRVLIIQRGQIVRELPPGALASDVMAEDFTGVH